MKIRLILAVGAVFGSSAPVCAQAGGDAPLARPEAPAWFAVRSAAAVDPRLAPPRSTPPAEDHWNAARGRLSAPAVMMIGGAVGCVVGALTIATALEDTEESAARFNGCILGGSAGIFLGGVYALATGR